MFNMANREIELGPPSHLLCQDAKINSMERGLRDMEEELLMLKSNGLLSCEERQEEMKQMEVYRSHTKFMKNKVRETAWNLMSLDQICTPFTRG